MMQIIQQYFLYTDDFFNEWNGSCHGYGEGDDYDESGETGYYDGDYNHDCIFDDGSGNITGDGFCFGDGDGSGEGISDI